MYSCAFFGHREYPYTQSIEEIERGIVMLITEYEVTEFYVGLRGAIDRVCMTIMRRLKQRYPFIRCIRVWSYRPRGDEDVVEGIDETVYLLERFVPPTYAIAETNKILVQKVDYILSGILHRWGGAWMAVEYAKKKGKKVIEVFGD